jgi:16S rRNA (cytidine1402-2'-O)-methyltransferase
MSHQPRYAAPRNGSSPPRLAAAPPATGTRSAPAACAPEPRPGPHGSQPDSPADGRALAPGLYVVATPIGNLGDLTRRAEDHLARVDAVVCEDTRVTGKLLAAYGLDRPLVSYHEHNAAERRPEILERLARGQALALVSDAGTPLISDPGYKLVRAVQDAGHPVRALPGASAALAALAIAGLPTDRFFFQGFLPQKAGQRRQVLDELAALKASLVIYESPQRLPRTLAEMAETLGAREAAVARELTKRFEELTRAPLPDLAARYSAPPKGEVVIVVAPPGPVAGAADAATVDARLKDALAELSLRDAAARVAQETGWKRKAVYQRALALKAGSGR